MKKAKANRADRLSPIPKPSKRPAQPASDSPASDAQSAAPDLSHISAGLRHLARPIAELQFHPRNPRKHPERNIEAIRASLRQNGQYRPAVASDRTGQLVVVVGNGMLAAALAEGWTHLAVEPKSLTEAKENQLAITDNETAALATWDQELLGALMRDVNTGNDPDLDRMLAELGEREKVVEPDEQANDRADPQPVISYTLIFDDTDQQEAWFKLLRDLKKLYPDLETIGARLAKYLGEEDEPVSEVA